MFKISVYDKRKLLGLHNFLKNIVGIKGILIKTWVISDNCFSIMSFGMVFYHFVQ